MVMGGRLVVTRVGHCERHTLKAALLASALALVPALALIPTPASASPRENPLPPLPVLKPQATTPVIAAIPANRASLSRTAAQLLTRLTKRTPLVIARLSRPRCSKAR